MLHNISSHYLGKESETPGTFVMALLISMRVISDIESWDSIPLNLAITSHSSPASKQLLAIDKHQMQVANSLPFQIDDIHRAVWLTLYFSFAFSWSSSSASLAIA